MDENYVYEQIAHLSNIACQRMNEFSSQILKTRGGRIGSGMGALLEALWGYMMNQIILGETDLDCEIAWFPDNQYNDFSCIRRDAIWDAATRAGEYFRIEAKSMNTGADESKPFFHFFRCHAVYRKQTHSLLSHSAQTGAHMIAIRSKSVQTLQMGQ